MSQPTKRVHLFNCDNTCKLEPVEKLLEKFSSHVECVEKHSFRLTQMSEMVDKIPILEMDMAFFVVHAHESRVSINEDIGGLGCAKIYRALLQATGGDVIIVIDGDDNYSGNDEENREVISRWAKRKVSSQFSEEYLDGRRSFIFSWNKQHRAIHEQALVHHFDPFMKGQKFHYRPSSPKQPSKPEPQHQPTGPLKFHLFNCDGVCDLNMVENLLTATKLKLGFDFSVQKHNFTLHEITELSTETIPDLQMDFAMFVLHAHECLLINHSNLEQGYTKVYRALLEATGGDVIVVIGGDDKYNGNDEENREVISRWVKRKVASQFSDEYLDGRKSFIFSWNKQHRAIHEQAMLHHFDPNKKGQKFEYNPLHGQEEPKPATTPPARSKEKTPSFLVRRCYSSSVERKSKLKMPTKQESFPYPFEAVTGPRNDKEDDTSTHPLDSTTRSSSISIDRENTAISSNPGAISKEIIPPQIGETKDLTILGYDVSESSIKDVGKVMEDFREKLNLSHLPPIIQLPSISEVKKQLMDTYPRVCVLAIDADQIIRARGNQPEKINEYRQLLETAETHVDEKVVLLICGSPQPSSADVVKDFIKKTEKVVPAYLKEGKLSLSVFELYKIIAPTSVDTFRNPLKGNTLNFQQPLSFGSAYSGQPQGYHETLAKEWETIGETTPPLGRQQPQGATRNLSNTPTAPVNVRSTIIPGWVILKSKLRNGKISRCPSDVETDTERFDVPDDITENLRQKYSTISEANVRIIKDYKGKLRYTVELTSTENPKEGVEIADDETLMLNTLVRFGCVSFEPCDAKHRDNSDWQLPEFIIEKMKREYSTAPKVDLFVIEDEKGRLRYKAILETIINAIYKGKKLARRVKHFL